MQNTVIVEYTNIRHINMGYKEKISDLLKDDVISILDIIENNGYKARIVGGAVRNLLFGAPISDIDIATTALPNEIIKIFERENIKVVSSGIDHGTVTVVYNRKRYEITTLREDIETFGRKAKVSFSKSFKIDSNRRDFTINALYMDRNGKIYDYNDGISDIAAQKVRFIGNCRIRICEDYLRILRYFRFVAYYGAFKCDKEYLDAIYDLKKNISLISSERILSELLKILDLKDAYKIIIYMQPTLDELFSVKCNPLEVCTDIKLSNIEKLCLLLKFSERNLDELINHYKFSKQIKRLLRLQDNFCFSIEAVKKHLKQINKNDRKFFVTWLVVKEIILKRISKTNAESIKNELIEFINSEYVDFYFRASELTKYNLSESNLRKIMMQTKAFWISSDKNLSVKDCKKIAKNFIKLLE